ncbi:unnamed protein product [Rotaria sp. Silwood2]|nr:unnamed protein product [Rotaria sp. Silwood2]CAF2833871.1 unnamed protein product [Rotaria sp. Silwood2]CAF4157736.1 unnamed protein product [Rotaria sp. Silwood2]CAF4206410.1 unnamed protein product [Rotaria sp. Silwood2]
MEQTYERLSLFDNALVCYYKAPSIHEKLNDNQTNYYHRLAAIYVGIADIYSAKHDKDKSLNYLHDAFNTELNIEQPSTEVLLNCYNDISFILFTKEKYDESLFNYEKAVDINMQIYLATHPNIGTIHTYEHRTSLDIQLASLSVDHSDIARSFNNTAGIYHSIGCYEDGLWFCKNALNIYLKRMPENHPNLAILYGNMIELYDKLGRLNESLDLRYKKLDIYLATLQSDDPKICITERVFGEAHPATQTFCKNLEEILNHISSEDF